MKNTRQSFFITWLHVFFGIILIIAGIIYTPSTIYAVEGAEDGFVGPPAESTKVKFSFAVISDTHDENKCNITQGTWSQFAISIINERKPNFVIGAGDLIAGGGRCLGAKQAHNADAQWAEFKKVYLDELDDSIPFVPVAGNHDGASGGNSLDDGMKWWKTFWTTNVDSVLPEARSATGFPDGSYRFQYQGVNFSMITYYHSWGFTTAEKNWMTNNIKEGDLVFKHILPWNVSSGALALNSEGDIKNYSLFVDILKEKNIGALVSGHSHAFYDGYCNDIHFVNTGTLGKRALNSVYGMSSAYAKKNVFTWIDVMTDNSLAVSFYYYTGTELVLFDKKNFPATVQASVQTKAGGVLSGVAATCKSVQSDSPISSTATPLGTASVYADAGVFGEIELLLRKPILKISIPGVSFTEPENLKQVEEADGTTYVYFPYLSEYISAVYKYLILALGVVAMVLIIYAGFIWITSGGSPERITQAKSKITHSIIGLLLAVGSYTLLYTINPELVEFRNLKVLTIQGIPIGDVLEGEFADESTIPVALSSYSGAVPLTGLVPNFDQCDGRWNKAEYGASTVCEKGCGLAAYSMILNYYKAELSPTAYKGYSTPPTEINPKTLAHWIDTNNVQIRKAKGTTLGSMLAIGNAYGLGAMYRKFSDVIDTVNTAILAKKPVLVYVGNTNREELTGRTDLPQACKFTKLGHYIVLSAYDPNTKIYGVQDPGTSHDAYLKRNFATVEELISCHAFVFIISPKK